MWIKLIKADFSANNIGTLKSYKVDTTGLVGLNVDPKYVSYNTDGETISNVVFTFTVKSGYKFVSGSTIKIGSDTKYTASGDLAAGNTFTITMNVNSNIAFVGAAEKVETGGGEDEGGDEPTDPTPGGTTTLTLHKSAVGNSILDYQDVWKMFGAGTLATLGSQIIGVDVSAYAGQQISITAAQSVISGANYAMFCSNLPNAYIQSLEQLDGYNSFGTASDYIAEDYDNLIESFNISVIAETTNTVTKTVPANTKYLFFSNLNAKCSDPLVVVGNTTGALTTYVTEHGWSALDYQTYFYLTANSTFQGYKSKVIAVDVSSLVGQTLSITATQSVVDGAYYSFFTNALPTGISSINEIDGLAYNSNGKYNFTDSNLVENFVVSTEHNITNTITKVVPTGAKYLFVATCDQYGSSEIKLAQN